MNLPRMEEALRERYSEVAADYRRQDEIEVRTDHHCWIWKTLSDICNSLSRPMTVLDVGCGAGRYFHCLSNVETLVGMDISPEMLSAAEHPVREEMLEAPRVNLICANVYSVTVPDQSFDLVYSIGMFGHGCPLTPDVLQKFHRWLRPDGILFVDAPDWSGLPAKMRAKKRLKQITYALLPGRARARLEERKQLLPVFAFSRNSLNRLCDRSSFRSYWVYPRPCSSPCWKDRKLECVAAKSQVSQRLLDRLEDVRNA